MSKEIKITNGSVILKDFCSRGLRKQINKALYNDIQMKLGNQGDTEYEGFSMEALDKANDVALLGMVEKIIINEEEKKIELAIFDEMNDRDVTLIIDEINKITTKEFPND